MMTNVGGSTSWSLNYATKTYQQNKERIGPTADSNVEVPQNPQKNAVDEYIPSASIASYETDRIRVNGKSQTISDLEQHLIRFMEENATLPIKDAVLRLSIDGEGQFVAQASTEFSIHQDSSDNHSEKLKQQYVDELNSIQVNGQSLGEAFLQAYSQEFGVDLNEARANGEEVGGMYFNFSFGNMTNPGGYGATARGLGIGNTNYSICDGTGYKSSEDISPDEQLSEGPAINADSSVSVTQTVTMESDPIVDGQGITFKLPSFMTSSLKMQKADSPLSEITKELNRAMLEGVITRVLETNGVTLSDGDILSMTLSGQGELAINADGSSIGGATGDEIRGLCNTLSSGLNQSKSEEGRTLGDALLEQFADEMGFDLDAAREDPNFAISFSFKYNSKTGKNEITGVKSARLDAEMLNMISSTNRTKSDKHENEIEIDGTGVTSD